MCTDDLPKLLNCPFCGREARLIRADDEDPASVSCDCGCEIVYSDDADAIAAWNARAAVTDEQFAMAVHDGEAWQVVRTCENVLDHSPCAFECSECGFSVRTVPDGPADWQTPFWRHCPNCGAKVVAE